MQWRRLRAAAAQSLIENERAKTTKTEKTAAEKIAINNTSEGASDAASYAFVGEQPEEQEERRKEGEEASGSELTKSVRERKCFRW